MILIKPAEVIDYAFLPRETINPLSIKQLKIDITQQRYLLPRFGDDMFESMIDGDYFDFVKEYVKPALAFYVRASIIDELSVLMSEQGAVVFDYNLVNQVSQSSQSQANDVITIDEEVKTSFSETENKKTNTDSEKDYNSTHGEMTYVEQEVNNLPIDRVDNVIEGIEDQRVNETQDTTSGGTKESGSNTDKNSISNQSSSSENNSEVNRLRAATSVERRVLVNRAMSDANVLIEKAIRYVEKNLDMFPNYQKQSLSSRVFF